MFDPTGFDGFTRRAVPADASHAARVRTDFDQWLMSTFALEPELHNDLLLAANEALANAASYAYAAGESWGTMTLDARYDPARHTLSVVVADHGCWQAVTTRVPSRNGGRGIPLIHALSDHASIEPGTHGTTVHMQWNGVRDIRRLVVGGSPATTR